MPDLNTIISACIILGGVLFVIGAGLFALGEIQTRVAITINDQPIEPVVIEDDPRPGGIALHPVEFGHLNRIDNAARAYVAHRRKQAEAVGVEWRRLADAEP